MLLRRYQNLGRQVALAACAFVALGSLSGCALWNKELWNPARFRDERATDIDRRLSENRPIVENPF